MNLRWRGSSRSEEAFESWFHEKYQELVLSGRVSLPSGPCPDEAFLQNLARKSGNILFSDLRVEHAASCPICMRKLLGLRKRVAFLRRRLILASATSCCLLIIISLVLSVRHPITSRRPVKSELAIARTIDLSSAGTFRGEQSRQLQSVSLPKGVVALTLILPRFSEEGLYAVAVTRTRSRNDVVAHASASTKREGTNEELSVLLDLRSTTPGWYFLSTTGEKDDAPYYYPLEIQ